MQELRLASVLRLPLRCGVTPAVDLHRDHRVLDRHVDLVVRRKAARLPSRPGGNHELRSRLKIRKRLHHLPLRLWYRSTIPPARLRLVSDRAQCCRHACPSDFVPHRIPRSHTFGRLLAIHRRHSHRRPLQSALFAARLATSYRRCADQTVHRHFGVRSRHAMLPSQKTDDLACMRTRVRPAAARAPVRLEPNETAARPDALPHVPQPR